MTLKYFKDKWSKFTALGIWIIAIVTTFLLTPPLLGSDFNSININFCRFIVAGLIALLFVPLSKYNQKTNFLMWYKFAWTSFIAAMILVVFYLVLYDNWSVKWYNKTLVIGDHMSVEAQQQIPRIAKSLNLPVVDNKTLVRARRGETQYIWPFFEIKRRFYILCILYIICIVIVAIFLISVLQSIYCYEQDIKL